jgi:hypothetical protein
MEPTAAPTGYIIYTRVDDGAFDNGIAVVPEQNGDILTYRTGIKAGHIYSFKVQAFNDGGKSFESETVSIGMPENPVNPDNKVLIVNNFDRVSGPVFFDTPDYAGFDNMTDSGIPYIRGISYIGEMYQKDRNMEWLTNDNPGFGGSHQDYAGKTVAGNTFDFAYTHGKAVMKAGYPFYSCSNEAFCSNESSRTDAWAVDLICGKQVTTVVGNAEYCTRYTVFTEELQQAITDYTAEGGNILVSGANIATDIWGGIYKYEKDDVFRQSSIKFAENILGFRYVSGHAGRTGEVRFTDCERMGVQKGEKLSFHNCINEECYSVESPDGISARGKASTFMRYADTDIPAAVCMEGEGYKTVSIGFPIEIIKEESHIDSIISLTLDYFSR